MSATLPSIDESTLGVCPDCDTEITTSDVLIEYETDGGHPACWAECPGCGTVVHPE